MATQGSSTSNRNTETMTGYWTPGPNGTKPGDYRYVPSGNHSDTDGEQSASGDDGSNGGATGNPAPGGGPTTAGGGGNPGDGTGTPGGNGGTPGIGGIVDLGNGNGDDSSFDLAGADAPLQPIFDTVNNTVGTVTESNPLDDVVNVANTAGIGTIGAAPDADGHSNLITDVLNLPGSTLAGDLNGGLSNITAGLNDTLNATTGLLNNAMGSIGLPTDSILGGGTGNLISDVVALPGNALDGGIPQVIGDLTGTVTGIAGGADGLGGSGLLQPVTNLVDSVGGDLQNNAVASIAGDGVLGGLVGGTAGSLGGSSSGDAAHVGIGPQSDDGIGLGLLSGSDAENTVGINALDVGPDGPEIANLNLLSDAGGLDTPVLGGVGLGGITGSGSDGLLTINGGNNADNGGLLGGVVGNLDGSSTGQLINADAGPQDNGLGLGILTAEPDGNNTANVSAVDVGPDGPQLADLGVLTGDGIISVPTLNGVGLDSLTGDLLGGGVASGATDTALPAPVVASLGDTLDLLPGSIGSDHGIVDVNGHHII